MEVGVGPHAEMDDLQLILTRPQYVHKVLADPTGEVAGLAQTLQHYIAVFDKKAFVEKCNGNQNTCTRPVTRGSTFTHGGFNPNLTWWCDVCDPCQLSVAGTLHFIRTYVDALKAVEVFGRRKKDYITIVKCIAKAKGAPPRATITALEAFFGRSKTPRVP